MHRGYLKLWRKTKDSIKGAIYLGFWAYCLLEAAYQQKTVTIHGQSVVLQPGQFVFGRKRWATELGLTEKQIRACIRKFSDNRFENAMIGVVQRYNKFTIYNILNWPIYQIGDTNSTVPKRYQNGTKTVPSEGQQKGQQFESDKISDYNSLYLTENTSWPAEGPAEGPAAGQQRASSGPQTKKGRREERKNKEEEGGVGGEHSSFLKEKIESMAERYDPELFGQVYDALKSTRQTYKISLNILFAQLEAWLKFPVAQVEAGMRKYVDRDYAAQGKSEKYLMGIIRNIKPEEYEQKTESTGSHLLDWYYKTHGESHDSN
jgi:hypothetical protein